MNQAISREHPVAKGFRAVGILLCAAIALISYRYLAGIGPVPEIIPQNLFFHPWLPMHVLAAATALLVGPTQFLTRRPERLGIHRVLGRVYGVSCLVGSVSGFMLALGAVTGPVSTMGFGLLAIAWFVTVAMGWRKAVQRNLPGHRRWMIRSFALTLAAVTLRLYLPLLPVLPIDFADGYRAVSFLCWLPNLVAAEIFLRRRKN